MLENTESLLPVLKSHASQPQSGRLPRHKETQKEIQNDTIKVISIGLDEDSLDELDRLLTTLGVIPIGRVISVPKKIQAATYFGAGKLEETKLLAEKLEAQAVIVDVELSPNQLRNLEKALGRPILDRPGVIIEIFSAHARTREAKTQVALARLQYLLPRLTHFWTHFERQRGGNPGGRGMGETQIEVDRRLIKKQIVVYRQRLAAIELERKVQRSGRKDLLKVALVGYTNAGKSTLLNALTHSNVRVEDKLFATLDASVKTLDPNSHPPIVAIDTVGFISRLPPALVASFRSTLEEVEDADMLIHVVDASASQAKEQFEETEKILGELNVADKPRIVILNKMDRIENTGERNLAKLIVPGAMAISALNKVDISLLRDSILKHFQSSLAVWEVLVPYSESKLEAQLYQYGSIELHRHMPKGTFYRLRIEDGRAKKLGLEKYRL